MSFRMELVKRTGRPPIFETPDDLWRCFTEYVALVEQHEINLPTYVVKGSKREEGKGGKIARPLTFQAFMAFAGISSEWSDFEKYTKQRSEEFSEVTTRIRRIIESDQVEGGLANIYNSNLTARLNGLKERTDHTSGDESLNVKFEVVSKQE